MTYIPVTHCHPWDTLAVNFSTIKYNLMNCFCHIIMLLSPTATTYSSTAVLRERQRNTRRRSVSFPQLHSYFFQRWRCACRRWGISKDIFILSVNLCLLYFLVYVYTLIDTYRAYCDKHFGSGRLNYYPLLVVKSTALNVSRVLSQRPCICAIHDCLFCVWLSFTCDWNITETPNDPRI